MILVLAKIKKIYSFGKIDERKSEHEAHYSTHI